MGSVKLSIRLSKNLKDSNMKSILKFGLWFNSIVEPLRFCLVVFINALWLVPFNIWLSYGIVPMLVLATVFFWIVIFILIISLWARQYTD